jgi:TetR/AcrR family transcriptional regulator
MFAGSSLEVAMNIGTPPRREREKLRQREELLAAALELFAEKGFHNVSMHEIAQKAEFAVGTLYRFFKDKEDLYKALIRSRAERFHATLIEILSRSDSEDVLSVLKNYVAAKASLLTGGAAMLRLYFAETRGASFNIRAGLDREILELYDDLVTRLAAVFQAGVQRNIFRPLDPYYMALALESLTNGFLQCWIEDPERHPYEASVPLILDIFCKGVLRE